jgi:hypothetical protein
MGSLRYRVPTFLSSALTQKAYERWLRRKALAHVKRDKKRGNKEANAEAYRIEIHRAVCESNGLDHYTGEHLEWPLVSSYDNAKSKEDGRKYKATLALLPTVDHIDEGLGQPSFAICAWRTNDAKNDLSHGEFIELCRRVISHHERTNGGDFAQS